MSASRVARGTTSEDGPSLGRTESSKRNGKVDPEREAFLRRRCPHAGYRAYGHDRDGIGDPDERQTITRWKSIRGYLQLTITDIATEIPLVGLISDATTLFEPDGLRPLLQRLYGLWSDIPLEGVVGDKLYDVAEACLMCELEFGVVPVFVRRPSHGEDGGVALQGPAPDTRAPREPRRGQRATRTAGPDVNNLMRLRLVRPSPDVLARPVNPWTPWFDKTFAVIVRAIDERSARSYAQGVAGNERRGVYRAFGDLADEVAADVWLDGDYTTCTTLTEDGDPGVLVYDRREA